MNLTITSDQSGERIDVVLATILEDLSRSRIQSLIKAGHVTVDGHPTHAHFKVKAGMDILVDVPPPAPSELEPENIPLEVLFEDSDIIVINKPAGLIVHPATGRYSGTLANALLHHCPDLAGIGGKLRPGIVHRLDMDTSGTLVAAKNDVAFQSLAGQFKNRTVRKKYAALVHGTPRVASKRIETLIGRHAHHRKKMAVQETPRNDSKGRPAGHARLAITEYVLVETFGVASFMRVTIETGRTHQIRVHLSHMGFPIVGDLTYGGRRQNLRMDALVEHLESLPLAERPDLPVARQMLHAETLILTHPAKGKRMTFKSPLPDDMQTLLGALRKLQSPSSCFPQGS